MSKHNDRKKLNGMLRQFRSPLDLRAAGPPQDPLVAAVEELHRIAKKALHGLTQRELATMPAYPRGWVSPLGFWPVKEGRP